MGAFEYQPVYLDILPGECPNKLNPRRARTVRMAVLGTPTFEPWRINTTSLTLRRADGIGGVVRPIQRRSGTAVRFADVSRPSDGDLCGCNLGRDGIPDLVLSYSKRELMDILKLDSSPRDRPTRLVFSGELLDGSPLSAVDCVAIAGLMGTRDR